MGGGAKSSSKSYSGSGQKWAKPYAKAGASAVQGVFNANQPHLQELTEGVTQQLGGLRDMGSQYGQTAQQGNQFLGDVLGGNYLNGNPHLEAMIQAARGGITDQVNSQFSLAGRYGSNAHGAGLGRELGNMETGLRYQNYSDEINRMMGASQMAAGNYGNNQNQQLAASGVAAEMPYIGMNNMANSLGALFNGGKTKTKETGQDPIWGAIGAGLGAAGMAASGGAFASDIRVKTNVEKVGEFADGLGKYEWNYRPGFGYPTTIRFQGVMADEVKELRPHAYIADFNGTGYSGVDYAAL